MNKPAPSKNKKQSQGSAEPVLPPIELKPSAFEKSEVQGLLIGARQLPGFPIAMGLLWTAFSNRADRILLDYNAQSVQCRNRIDGLWEPMAAMDRASGDAALFILKKIWGMDPNDRRNKQQGSCGVATQGTDWIVKCMSQGVPTGERVLIEFTRKKPILKTLSDLGMREEMQVQLKALLNADGGLVLISAPPGHGLPTTWQIALESADKFVRDWVSVEDQNDHDPEMINITQHFYDESAGLTPDNVLSKLLLKQPDVFVLPSLLNESIADRVLSHVKTEHKHAVTRIHANDPIEAVILLMTKYRSQAKVILDAVNGVLCQRLVRKLCDKCRQPYQPSPQLLAKLGIPPGKIQELYQPYVPPPPEQRVDAKGNPIEIPVCPQCRGRGYYGRVGVFELLVLTKELKAAIAKYAKNPDAIRQYAVQRGHLNLQTEGVLAAAIGATSLQELQRMMQAK